MNQSSRDLFGFTFESLAIEAWLRLDKLSAMTRGLMADTLLDRALTQQYFNPNIESDQHQRPLLKLLRRDSCYTCQALKEQLQGRDQTIQRLTVQLNERPMHQSMGDLEALIEKAGRK